MANQSGRRMWLEVSVVHNMVLAGGVRHHKLTSTIGSFFSITTTEILLTECGETMYSMIRVLSQSFLAECTCKGSALGREKGHKFLSASVEENDVQCRCQTAHCPDREKDGGHQLSRRTNRGQCRTHLTQSLVT